MTYLYGTVCADASANLCLFVCLLLEHDRLITLNANTRRFCLSVSSGLGVTDSPGGMNARSQFMIYIFVSHYCFHIYTGKDLTGDFVHTVTVKIIKCSEK